MVKSKFSIVLHIMTLLAFDKDSWHSSSFIASSLNVNPVLVRNELAALKQYRLIESKEGKNGGVRLLKPANTILLSDLFKIIKGDHHVLTLSKNTPNPKCPIGKQINGNLENLFENIDNQIINSLSNDTLEDFKNQF